MTGLSTPAEISNKPAMLDTKTLLEANAKIEQQIKDYETQQLNDGKTTETTISRTRMLNQVAKLSNLNEPEQVKEWLRKSEWQNSTKTRFIDIYTGFLNFMRRKWNPPRYTPNAKLPFIPTEEEIDALIAGSAKTVSTALQTLKETAMRIGELTCLKWIDIDAPHKAINITPEKGSNPHKWNPRIQQDS
jgi:integrase